MLLEGDDDPEGSEEDDWNPHLDADSENGSEDTDRFGLGLWTGSYGDERERERGSEWEPGQFYGFSPPQETMSRALVNFDPHAFMDGDVPRHADVPTERCLFKEAMFFGQVTDCEWIDEDSMSEKLWKNREKLDIFVGRDMHDPKGPWRMFLVHRTFFGSRIEEIERAEGQ